MSTYRELRGLKVKYLAADPDPASRGDVWYNSTTFELKGFVGLAAWSSAANMIVGRYSQGGAGTQTAAFVAGGFKTPDAATDETYEYNGVGWSTGEDMAGTDRFLTACGTLTAGLGAGGYDGTNNIADSEEYDGTNWAEGDNLNTARQSGGQFGIQTAAVLVGGFTTTQVASTEEYNGSSWTAGENANTATEHIGAAGTLTVGLKCGGVTSTAASAVTEEYDGTDWTSVNNMNTARRVDATFGTQTAAIAAGGYTTTAVANVEAYDGTTWTEIADIAAATNYGSGVGTHLAGMHTGGNPSYKTATEEYNNTFTVVTAGAWTAGGNVTTARTAGVGMGTQTAGLFAAGITGSNVNHTEEYDGSSWTETANLGTARRAVTCHGFGTQTAGGFAGGYVSGAVGNTELYDGSSWTEAADLGTAVYDAGQFGTQTAAVSVGGGPIPDSRVTNEWDGSSWTAGGSMTVRRQQPFAVGTLTAGLVATGQDPSVPGEVNVTEEYNGTAWATSPGTVNTARISVGASGIQTAALAFGGLLPPGSATTTGTKAESYDGTNWITAPSLTTSRGNAGSSGAGTATTALFFAGGPSGSVLNATEEFIGETSADTASTIDFD